MENWELRHEQVRSIVGTNDVTRLSAALEHARAFVAAQPVAAEASWEFVSFGVDGRDRARTRIATLQKVGEVSRFASVHV
jgi:hypothetical protein